MIFDCTAVCPYDIVPGIGCARVKEGRKALSRIGSLLQNSLINVKRLFHLLVALAFMFLTLMGASVTYSEWEGYRRTPEQGLVHFTMFGGFTVFLAILSLYSYAKARSVR